MSIRQLLEPIAIFCGWIILLVAAGTTVVYSLNGLYDFWLMLGIVVFLTYLFSGPVSVMDKWFQRVMGNSFLIKWKWVSAKMLAVWSVLLIAGVSLFLFTILSFPVLTKQFHALNQRIPEYFQMADRKLTQVIQESKGVYSWKTALEEIQSVQANQPSQETPWAQNALSQILGTIQRLVTSAFSITGVLTASVSGLVYMLTGFMLLFYFLLDAGPLLQKMIEALPKRYQHRFHAKVFHLHHTCYLVLKTQLLLSLFSGSMMYAVYALFHLPYAGFLGFFMGLCCMVPVLGPWVGMLPVCLLVLVSDQPWQLISIVVITAGLFILKEQLLLPRLLRKSLDIHPVLMILTLLLCWHLGGLFGLLLAHPTATLIHEWLYHRELAEFTPKKAT
ncbi:MAG: AI-2E family transporter [Cyanobacteria bacterium]|nr:AI-2E family transporter [Cyanobacteriota bacterium]